MFNSKKLFATAVAFTMALSLVAVPASAQTTAELTAQINSLLAMIAQLQAQIAGSGSASMGTAVQYNTDLTLGSTGADVTSLQQFLVGKGYLQMPAGVAYGYFGPLTQAAVASYQASVGITPAVGYFGPITRANVNALNVSTGGTTGGTTTGGTTTGGITTPGVEGTVTVSLNPSPASGVKLYEGDSMKQVLGIKLEPKTSDMSIQRIKVDLDSITNTGDNLVYTKIAEKIYVLDENSNVLASSDLNSTTVIKDGSDYFITLAGFNYVVPAGDAKVLYIALDARSSWDSTYDGDSWSIGIQENGVRGVDGAGIDQYGPSTGFTRTFSSTADLVDSASLSISLNSATPATQQVICTSGTDSDECDGLEVARIDFKAEKDDVMITDFVLDIVRGGASVATSSTAYLYDGSTLVGSASVAGTSATAGTATFSDIDWTVSKDTTKTLSVKFDIVDAALAADTFVASTDAADTTAENSAGTAVTPTGSADGKTITIRNVGPEITLLSKSVTAPGVPQSSATNLLSTSTLTAKFNVRVKALGADLYLGKVASTSDATQGPVFSMTGATNSFKLYSSGAASSVNNATSSSYTISTTCVDSTPAQTCTLAEGSSVDIEVTYLVPGRTAAGAVVDSGLYAVGLEKVNWAPASSGAIQSTTFMAGLTEWRTSDISFP